MTYFTKKPEEKTYLYRLYAEQREICKGILKEIGITREEVIARRVRDKNGTFEDKRMVSDAK